MKERKKRASRIYINREVKEEILKKSNGRCSHCGKLIEVGGDFTVEHAVPISKGSDNDLRNLVALCSECNSLKADKVILKDAGNYYKFLNKEDLLELMGYIKKYSESIEWLDYDNWLKDDECILTPIGITTPEVWVNSKEGMRMVEKVVLRKAEYKDLEDVYNYMLKNGLDRDLAKDAITCTFTFGALYLLYNGAKELVGTFSVTLCNGGYGGYKVLPAIDLISIKKKYHYALQQALELVSENILKRSKSLIAFVLFHTFPGQENEEVIDVLKEIGCTTNFFKCVDDNPIYSLVYCKSNTISRCNSNLINKEIRNQSMGYSRLLLNRKKFCERVLPKDMLAEYRDIYKL